MKSRWLRKRKDKGIQDVLDRLNEYIDGASPELIAIIIALLSDQGSAFSLDDLKTIILNGKIDDELLSAWKQDYGNFINEKLKPKWFEAMRNGAAKAEKDHKGFFYDPMSDAVQEWIRERGAELCVNMTEQTKDAVSLLLEKAAVYGEHTPDELARVIRPIIGLTDKQAEANLKYYFNVRDTLLKENPDMKRSEAEKKAREAAGKYAEKQRAYRARMIADTELITAYNQGEWESVKQAVESGWMKNVHKVWCTAADGDRVCDVCQALEGQEVGLYESFVYLSMTFLLPPVHPFCRCAVKYIEKRSMFAA